MLKEQLQKETQEAKGKHPQVVEEWLTQKCLKSARKGKTYKMFFPGDTLPDGSELTMEDIFDFARRHDLSCSQLGLYKCKLSWK